MKRLDALCDILPGQRAVVRSLHASEALRRRLLDIGLTPGTEVECVGKSPCGDPTAFLIRGAVIALRAEDSRGILIEPSGGAAVWD
ncbi:MAG: ferrous iron transport protein A [Ruminococcaceae bacterium]|nr:ferrous iron transport protein A [Oscillospiraceae bacterium]